MKRVHRDLTRADWVAGGSAALAAVVVVAAIGVGTSVAAPTVRVPVSLVTEAGLPMSSSAGPVETGTVLEQAGATIASALGIEEPVDADAAEVVAEVPPEVRVRVRARAGARKRSVALASGAGLDSGSDSGSGTGSDSGSGTGTAASEGGATSMDGGAGVDGGAAVARYRAELRSWLGERFFVQGTGVPSKVLTTRKVSATLRIDAEHVVTAATLHPTGDERFDAAATVALAVLVGQRLPSVPDDYPGPLQSSIRITFVCPIGACS